MLQSRENVLLILFDSLFWEILSGLTQELVHVRPVNGFFLQKYVGYEVSEAFAIALR